jgi:hypothetical protein
MDSAFRNSAVHRDNAAHYTTSPNLQLVTGITNAYVRSATMQHYTILARMNVLLPIGVL